MSPVFKSPISAHHQLFSDALLMAKYHLDQGHSEDALALCRYALLAAPDLYPQAMGLLKQAAFESNMPSAVGETLSALPDTPPQTATDLRPWPVYPVLDLEGLKPLKGKLAALPRISVITVSFNSARYIEETILSVRNQGYPNLEHILIDGGSTDGTLEIVERHRDHFAKIVVEPDKGQADALTKGFRLATGELVTWLNSDDLFMPGALMALAACFVTTGAEVVAGVIEAFGEDMESRWHFSPYAKDRLDLADITDIDGQWLESTFFYQPEVMFTRDLWRRAGGFIDTEIFYCVDWDLWARFGALKARFARTEKHIARYRVHKQQKTFQPNCYVPELRELARLYGPEIRIVNGPEGTFFLPGDAKAAEWVERLEKGEPAEVRATEFALSHALAGTCAIDIGPGPGLLAVRLAGLVGEKGRVVAFDGHEHTHFLLKRTFAAHGLGQAKAVLGFPFEGPSRLLRFDPPPPTVIRSQGFGIARAYSEQWPVPTHGFEICEENGMRISFIRLDAAGLEALALQGMQSLLVRHQPSLLIKCDPAQLVLFGQSPETLVHLLTGIGYQLAAINEDCYIQAKFHGGEIQ
ncbi:MAG: glycosyltransferase [Alphaproteobacteria bacterium]|nr:glycosyltransferase [Alphaproteobacteria bacterium]